MKKQILITGANGFIGSFLVEEALRQGFDVYAGVRASADTALLKEKGVPIFETSYADPHLFEKRFEYHLRKNGPFDFVIHNAGTTGTKGKADFLTVNYNYTRTLIHILKQHGMPTGKFLFVSSLSAHGPGNAKTFDPIAFDGEEHPKSGYGRSKWMAEQFIKSQYDFPYLIVRPTAVYGPRDRDFLQFFKMVSHGIEPYIGRHRQMISMLYVKDFATAAIKLLESSAINASYNISDNFEYEKEQLGTVIRGLLKTKTVKVKIPLAPLRVITAGIEKMHRVFGYHPFLSLEKLDEISESNWLCDSRPLWTKLEMQPAYDLERGLKETADWYLENGWI